MDVAPEATFALKRREATVVAADVVGFSRLMAAAEQAVVQRLFAIRRDIIDPAIRAEGGRIVKTMGDGMLVEFQTPVAALRVSRFVQEQATQHECGLPETERIRFRIGINHGSVLVDGDDLLGDVVNIAARLETLAPPGGICVSRAVHDLLDDVPADQAVSLGPQYVRNIPTPVEVWQIKTGVDTGAPNLTPRYMNRPSVLVLPFDTLSDHAEDGHLADGITDDVISALARFRSLFVIARGSSFAYRGQDLNLSRIASDTGARYLVRGSIRRAGSQLRVQAQLIGAAEGEVIWSGKFDSGIEDIFDVQDKITQSVVVGIAPEIGAHERRIVREKPTESLTAWELCQRGLGQFDRRTAEGMKSAYQLFQEASRADPAYALPNALLARTHAVRIFSGRSTDPGQDIGAGMHYCARAIELDDRLELGHQVQAQLLLIQGREAEARAALARAKALNDNDAFGYSVQTYINLFQPVPDTEEMEEAGLHALRLSPQDPLAWSFQWMLVMAVWMRDGLLAENVRHYLAPASRLPGAEAFVHIATAVTALRRGDRAEAERCVGRAMGVRSDLTLQIIRHSFRFPKWPELVAGVGPELEEMLTMGLPTG